jgi:hypothetical protein
MKGSLQQDSLIRAPKDGASLITCWRIKQHTRAATGKTCIIAAFKWMLWSQKNIKTHQLFTVHYRDLAADSSDYQILVTYLLQLGDAKCCAWRK